MNDVIFYTDGAYSPSRDQGGVGIVMINNDKVILEYSNGYKHTSNNQMEIGAVIIALRLIKSNINSLVIYTDSMYVIGCAIKGWKRSKNKALWKEFDKQFQRVSQLCSKIEFRHIKGHSGNKYNAMADVLAVKGSQLI